jgi:hypothetical protein
VELIAEREPLAQFELDAAALIGRLETEHVPLDRTAAALARQPAIALAHRNPRRTGRIGYPPAFLG